MTFILACGDVYVSYLDSLNLVYATRSSTVWHANLLGLRPFDDAITDLSYTFHVLELTPRGHIACFLQEIWRILQPCCVLRPVVPELENLCRPYLHHPAKVPVICGAPATSTWRGRHG